MSEDVLARLRALEQAATPGPWGAASRDVSGKLDSAEWSGLGWEVEGPPDECNRGQFSRGEDALLIAEARNALPALLDVAEAARATIADFDRQVAEFTSLRLKPGGDADSPPVAALRAALEKLR